MLDSQEEDVLAKSCEALYKFVEKGKLNLTFVVRSLEAHAHFLHSKSGCRCFAECIHGALKFLALLVQVFCPDT